MESEGKITKMAAQKKPRPAVQFGLEEMLRLQLATSRGKAGMATVAGGFKSRERPTDENAMNGQCDERNK